MIEETIALYNVQTDRFYFYFERKHVQAQSKYSTMDCLASRPTIDYKPAAITYKVRSTSTPAYLHSLLSDRVINSTMSLRSSSRPMLNFDITRTAYGTRTFSVAALIIWNKLPADIQLATS